MNEFKPGDVVVHPKYGRGIVQGRGWVGFVGRDISLPAVAAYLRRLVVIDPDNEDDMGRLGDILDNHEWEPKPRLGAFLVGLADALREFADPKPPKPEEPTGIGAVVEDAMGERWVWNAAGADGNHWLRVGPPTAWAAWTSIDAVRVLSEGVQP